MSSLSSSSHGQSAEALPISSSQQRSSSPHLMSLWQRPKHSTCSTGCLPDSFMIAIASSTLSLSGTTLPRRQEPSQVMIILESASCTRSVMAWAEKPPKITEWGAPIRAQASMAMASSGTMPM